MTRGDVAGVSTNTAELVTLAEQYGLQQRAMGLAYRGWALAYSGMPTEGLELANEAVGLLERSGARMYLSRVYGVIAEIDLIRGRYAEGLGESEKALRVSSEIGESFYVSRLLQTRAMLIQAIDSQDSSIELILRQSLELAIIQGAKVLELRAAIRLAGLWICQGKRDQARNLLRPICDWFT